MGGKPSTVASTHEATAVGRRVPLDRLPPDLLRYTADFCNNVEIIRLARCNRLMLRALVDARLPECIGESGLLLVEAAAARMAARRSAAATAAMVSDGARLSSNQLSLPDGGRDECTDSSCSASSSRAAAASQCEAAVAMRAKGAQSSRVSEEATSRAAEADARKIVKLHVDPLSASDMRVGRPVRMLICRGGSDLQSLTSCSSLRTLHIEFDYATLGLDPFWASTLSAMLPPSLQQLRVGHTIWIRDSADELQLPPSLTTLHLVFLRRFQPGGVMVESSPLYPFPLARPLPSLTHLTIRWRSEWAAQMLPPSLLSLHIDSLDPAIGQPPNASAVSAGWPLLHEGLQSLSLGPSVRQPLTGLRLPSSLTLLDLREMGFNEPIESLSLPPALQSLRLSAQFNQPIEGIQLPPSLTELHFHHYGRFNQPIERLQLPSTLASLHLSSHFNQPCARLQLPESLTELRFEDRFHGSLPRHLPDSIRSLHLGGKWHWEDERQNAAAEAPLRLPAAISSLTLPPFFPRPLRDHIQFAPNSALTHLHVAASLQADSLVGVKWPASLRSLHLNCWSSPADALVQLHWPATLQELRLDLFLHAEQLLSEWTPPSALTHLRLSHIPKRDDICWPPRLQRLSVESCRLSELSRAFTWPASVAASLTSLELCDESHRGPAAIAISGEAADLPPGLLPDGLRHLRLPPEWKGPLSQRLPLPATLTSLEIGSQKYASHFCASLRKLLRDLPPGLQSMTLHHDRPLRSILQPSLLSFFSPRPQPQPQLPLSLRQLRLRSRRHLAAEGWSTLLDERPDCSVRFDAC